MYAVDPLLLSMCTRGTSGSWSNDLYAEKLWDKRSQTVFTDCGSYESGRHLVNALLCIFDIQADIYKYTILIDCLTKGVLLTKNQVISSKTNFP